MEEEKIEVYRKARYMILYIMGAILMFVGSLFLISRGYSLLEQGTSNVEYMAISLIAGFVGAVFFGIAFVFMCKKFSSRKPILIVDKNGITDNSSAVSFGFVAWADVEDISSVRETKQPLIKVEISNWDKYFEKINKRQRILMEISGTAAPGVFCIALNTSGVRPEDIMPDIKRIFENNKQKIT